MYVGMKNKSLNNNICKWTFPDPGYGQENIVRVSICSDGEQDA